MASRLIHEYLQEYGTSLFNVSVYGLYTKAPTSETVDFVRVSGQRFWCMAYQGDAYGTLLREVAVPAGELAPAIGKLLLCEKWPDKVELLIASFVASYSGFSELLEVEPGTVFGWRDLNSGDACFSMNEDTLRQEFWLEQVRALGNRYSTWKTFGSETF